MDQSQTEAYGNRRKSGGRPAMGRSQNDKQEREGHHDLAHQRGNQAITARRMLAVTIAGKTGMNVEAGLAAGDDIKDGSTCEAARDLGNDIAGQIAGRETPARPKPDRDCWVEMTARDMADG